MPKKFPDRFALGLVITAGVCGFGCSDDGSGESQTSSSGPSRNKELSQLTVAEQTELCDWVSALLGGYGHRETCPDPDLAQYAADDLATCLASMVTTCSATVADYESCMKEVAKDPCSGKLAFGTAACTGLARCSTP